MGRPRSAARRWRLLGLALAVLILLGVAGIIVALSTHSGHQQPAGSQSSGSTSSGAIVDEAQLRNQAAAWVAEQVSHDAIVACDPLMCEALSAHGVAASSLKVLKPGATDPLDSSVVVSTATVRSMFGSRLAAVYAPATLASFGTGSNTIAIRQIAANGAAAFARQLQADIKQRKTSGTRVLNNSRIVVPAPASLQLTAGSVDGRLLDILATLGDLNHLRIASFSNRSPGASAGMPLRSVNLIAPNGGPWPAGTSYARSVTQFLHQQVSPYRPGSIKVMRTTAGELVLHIAFAAPSPFGKSTGGLTSQNG
jgi:hypothetical protein